MSQTEPRTIAFLSGKGGSGKTTVAIAMAKLLADIGYSCLLVDFDLATNGASYFFRNHLKPRSKGIWEALSDRAENSPSSHQVTVSPIAVNPRLYFAPSRVNLTTRGATYESVLPSATRLAADILSPLIAWARGEGVRYVLVDSQAGYSLPSIAVANVADVAIIVAEADAISSDAADNLLIQLGHLLPADRRYLINKIDVRDADTYRMMRNVFQSLNRLPPLPFDFSVRNAFGARQIPVNIDSPSPFLFALFETMKYAFTEIYEKLESYRSEHVDVLFEEYDRKMEGLLHERENLEQERLAIRTGELRTQTELLRIVMIPVVLITSGLSVIFMFSDLDSALMRSIPTLLLSTIGAAAMAVFLWTSRRVDRKLADEKMEAQIAQRIQDVERELDHLRSLLWATSREYLIDAEIAERSGREVGESRGEK